MKFKDSLVTALRSLSANKLRSSLTMLGIIIGVTAVIGLMSVGRGAQAMVTSTFEQMGTNVIFVVSRNPEAPGAAGFGTAKPTLSMDDAEVLANPNIVHSVVAIAPSSQDFAEVTTGDESVTVSISGVTPEEQRALNNPIASGQFISDRNVAYRDMVVVLGDTVADDLFGSDDPLGQEVKIKGKRFTVIGVLEEKGGAFMGVSMDEVVMTPLTTFQTKLFTQRTIRGEPAVQSIAVKVSSAAAIDGAIEEIEDVLRKRHRISDDDEDDFAAISQEEILGMLQQVTGVFTIFLGAIAGISLLVGGIGIMNIMLVSVTERTREIGIRKAVGAKRRDILIQFLLEAAMLSSVGGGIGIAGGWMVSRLASRIEIGGQTIPSVVSPDIVILAISVSVLIGIISGIYPALRAARLNPIDALHYG
ncbi:MAG: ABC transporter permease [Dehalococcoidales bacterium]